MISLNIPVANSGKVLSWDKENIDRLLAAAIQVAAKVGMRIDDDVEGTYLKEAENKGAKVDWASRAVLFNEAQIEETMAVMRRTMPAPRPLRPLCSTAGCGRDQKFAVGNTGNMLFDWDSWIAKAPSVDDLVALSHWAQGCDEVSELLPPVMLKDVDQLIEPLYNYAVTSKYCRKTVYHEQPTEPIHVRYLDKMARIVESHRGYLQPMPEFEFVNPPFRMGVRSIRTMLERVDSGACSIMGVGTMAVSGISAPVTVAGLAVTAVAEVLAGLTLFRVLRPGYGLRGNISSGSLDLCTARVSYFGMHTHLGNLAALEIITQGIGADATCLTYYRDANEPGMQALYEFGVTQTLFSCVLNMCLPEIGGLACGNTFSPHQAVLDMQVAREFDELASGFDLSQDALGIEQVIAAGFEQGAHMSSEHTLQHMMDGVPFSSLFQRGLPAAAGHNKDHTQTDDLMAWAEQAVRSALMSGQLVDPDTQLADELYECVREAAGELGIEPPPLV